MSEREEQVRSLIARLRVKAIQSREEGQRIRLTVHVATDAESNCHVRAEVWDDVANELEALLAQAQPSPQMTAMQMLQKCLAVVVGYEHTLSWPNHPNNEDMQAAAMDTTIAIEGAMLKLREEIGEAQPVADAPSVKRPYPRHPPCSIECRCDGDQVYAMIGSSRQTNQMESPCAYGDTLPEALRALADELEKEVGETPVRAGVQPPAEGFLEQIEAAVCERQWKEHVSQLEELDCVPQAAPTDIMHKFIIRKDGPLCDACFRTQGEGNHRPAETPTGPRHTHLPDDPDMCCSCLWVCECEPIPARHYRDECERQWKAHIASLDAPKRRDA